MFCVPTDWVIPACRIRAQALLAWLRDLAKCFSLAGAGSDFLISAIEASSWFLGKSPLDWKKNSIAFRLSSAAAAPTVWICCLMKETALSTVALARPDKFSAHRNAENSESVCARTELAFGESPSVWQWTSIASLASSWNTLRRFSFWSIGKSLFRVRRCGAREDKSQARKR